MVDEDSNCHQTKAKDKPEKLGLVSAPKDQESASPHLDMFFSEAFGLLKQHEQGAQKPPRAVDARHNKIEAQPTLRANDLFKLDKVPPKDNQGRAFEADSHEAGHGQQPVSERKLSFFGAQVSTYAVPLSAQKSSQDLAMERLAEESKELANYMYLQYSLTLEKDPVSGACLFPTQKRWLKGEEYGFLIRHYFAYSQLLQLY